MYVCRCVCETKGLSLQHGPCRKHKNLVSVQTIQERQRKPELFRSQGFFDGKNSAITFVQETLWFQDMPCRKYIDNQFFIFYGGTLAGREGQNRGRGAAQLAGEADEPFSQRPHHFRHTSCHYSQLSFGFLFFKAFLLEFPFPFKKCMSIYL